MTITTVGYGDIVPVGRTSIVITIFTCICGISIYVYVISAMQNIVSNLDVTSDIFKSRTEKIKLLLIRERVSEELKRKARCYMDKLYLIQKGANGSELKEFLPLHLYAPIVFSCVKQKLDTNFFLKKASSSFCQELAGAMGSHTFFGSIADLLVLSVLISLYFDIVVVCC